MLFKQKTKHIYLITSHLVRHPRLFYHSLSKRGQKLAFRGFIFFLILLIAVPAAFWYQAKHAKAGWWNEGWMHRKAIPVTNNIAEQNNVYISLTTDTSDTSKFQADCGDIRFTNTHGGQLPYYLASGCGTANTVIHVNFDVFPAGASTIYMYYGNPSAPNGFSVSDFATEASNYSVGTIGTEEKGPGPVAYWRFDEGQGGTAYNATSQTGINGTLQNSPTWKQESDCVSGKCLQYNGTNQYVSVDDTGTALDFVSTNQYTWSAWINYSGFPAGQTKQCFISKDDFRIDQKVDGFNLCLNQTSSTADPVICRGAATSGLTCSTGLGIGLVPNVWTHIEIQYDGASNWKTYINGNYKGSQSLAVTSDMAMKYFVGAGVDSTNNGNQTPKYFFQGKIDSVKIFPYQRSADQVKQDYNAGKSGAETINGTALSVGSSPKWMSDGLVSYWKMDEASGTTTTDASGNRHTGTLDNMQETGTAQTGSSTTAITDPANASLSSTDNAYNNMILQITSGALNGTQRTITGYTGATKTFAFTALGSDPTGATYIILHQTGGKFGNGMAFAGDNDYIEAGTAPDFVNTNQYTWSAWINYSGFPAGQTQQCFLSKDTPPAAKGNGFNLCLNQTGGTADVMISAGAGDSSGLNLNLQPNTWILLGINYDGTGNWKIYKNGTFQGNLSLTVTSDTTYKYFIGAGCARTQNGNQLPDRFFQGQIDDVRIYNRTLSPDELKQLSDWAPGPVGWWKMDDAVKGNNQTIVDSSGNGNNGTTIWGANSSGMDCTKNGQYGGACQFDGTDDYVNLGNSSTLNPKQISVSAWIKEGELPESYAGVVARGWAGSYMMDEQIDGSIRWRIGTMGSSCTTGTGAISNRNDWHHVEGIYDGVTAKMYLDGVLKGTCSLTDYLVASISNTHIGYADATYNFPGSIDDVRVYNYARTPKQVTEDMNAGHPVGGSPLGSQVAYYKFDEGKGGTAYDSSPNHQDLTLSHGTGGSNPTWTNSGKFGKALNFTRASFQYAWIDDTPTLSITSDLTLSAWIKPSSNSVAAQYDIINKWNSNNTSYLLSQHGSELRMNIDSDSNYKTTSGANLQTGQWYYVAGVYNAASQTVTLYVNGVDKGGSVTGTIPASIVDGVGKFFIGDTRTPTNYFDGTIDEVKIYSSALTPAQIALDMNQGKEIQLGGQSSANGATGQAAEYCVPGDATSCAGPVGEWKFDEGSSGTVHDSSGSGNDGTWYGTGGHWTVDGKYNNAGKFNGSDDYVAVNYNSILDITNNFSIDGWYRSGGSQTNKYLITKRQTSGSPYDDYSVIYGFNSGKYEFYSENYSGSNPRTALNTTVNDSNWHHIVWTYDGATLKGYLDGRLDVSNNVSFSITDRNVNLYFSNPNSGAQRWNGSVDQVQIFNYARTPAQIAWDMNRGKPVGWWKLDEGQGTAAYDSSGNSNTGTLTNMDPPNDWVDGKFGKALDFDGTNDYISAGTAPTFDSTKPASWSAWIKWTGFTKSTQCYFSKDRPAGAKTTGYNLCLNQTSSTADPIICKGSSIFGSLDCSSGLNLNLPSGTWINLSVIYDGAGNWKLYRDGQYMGTETFSVTSDNTANYFIGAGNAIANSSGNQVADYFFTGQIDDVRMYNYALTTDQLKQTYDNGAAIRFGD
jgi:hypothetical protein